MSARRCAFCGNVDDDVEAPTSPGDYPAHSWLNRDQREGDDCPPMPPNVATCYSCTRAFLNHELAKTGGKYFCRLCWHGATGDGSEEFRKNRRKDCYCDKCVGVAQPKRVGAPRRDPQVGVASAPDLSLPEDWTNVATICEMWGLNPKDVNENKKARRALAKYAENEVAEVEERDNPDGGQKTKWYRQARA